MARRFRIIVMVMFTILIISHGPAWSAWPRFLDLNDGTVLDTVSNLRWLKNANCFGPKTWDMAMAFSGNLAEGQCSLSDGSMVGDWHLPAIDELMIFTIAGYRYNNLNSSGFNNVLPNLYWSSSSYEGSANAYYVIMNDGFVNETSKTGYHYVWPVRSSQWFLDSFNIDVQYNSFRSQNLGQSAIPQQLTLHNRGVSSQAVTSISFTGTNADQFTIIPGGTTPCAGLSPTLAAGKKCTLNLEFTPSGKGEKIANLTIAASGKTRDIPVTGIGVTTIMGTIYDFSTGNPLDGATITITGGASTQSDSTGSFIFDPQPANGVYTVTITKTGYGTVTYNNLVISDTVGATLKHAMTSAEPLNITTTTLPPADTGTMFNSRIAISGGSWPFVFTVEGGVLPPGLSLDAATGAISGKPTTPGAYTFMIGVADSLGAPAAREFTIEVTAPLTMGTDTVLPRGTVGSYYANDIIISGGKQPYTLTKSSGYLPLDAYLTATGQIRGKISDILDFDSGILNPGYWSTSGAAGIQSGKLKISGKGSYAEITFYSDGGTVSFDWSKSEGATMNGFVFYLDNQLVTRLYGASQTSGTYTWPVTSGVHTMGWVNGTDFKVPANNWLTIDNVYTHKNLQGSYTFTLNVTDAAGRTTSKNFILNVDGALAFTTARLADGVTSAPYSQQMTAIGGRGPYTWALYSGEFPSGLSLDGQTGVISGTPSVVGSKIIVFSVTDSDGRVSYKDFTLNVASPLSIITATVPNGLKNEPYSEAVRIGGGIGPYVFTAGGQLPAGLSLNSDTGIISGTPTIAGYTTVSVTVTDSSWPTPLTTTQNIGIRVTSLLTITSSAVLPNVKKGVAINPVILVAKGGPSPYNWALDSGVLPSGITLDSATGQLSGTPAVPGDFIFTLAVSDANSARATKQFIWHVSDTLTILTESIPDGAIGVPYSFTLQACGGIPKSYSWGVKNGTLPSGLSLNPVTGTIIGLPTTRQSYSFTVVLSDGDTPPQVTEKTFAMDVADTLAIFEKELPNSRLGNAYTATVHANLGVPPYTWRLAGGELPPGLTFTSSPTVATLSGTPNMAGNYTFAIEVADSSTPEKKFTRSFTMQTYSTVAITTSFLKAVNRTLAYQDTIVVSSGVSPYLFSVISGSLPPGITLNASNGNFSGVTDWPAGQSTEFTVRVTDSGNPRASVDKQFTLMVVDPLLITTDSLPGGIQLSTYNTALSGQGGVAPQHWSLAAGTLPQGMSLNPDSGAISGTPKSCGSFPLTISLTDSSPLAATVQKSLQLEVDCIVLHSLNLTYSGTGAGSVNSSPSGINCTGPCSAQFAEGNGVTLLAVPDINSLFAGWSGACTSSSESCVLSMSADRSVGVIFNHIPFVRVITTGKTYDLLSEAYGALVEIVPATIHTREHIFGTGLVLDRNVPLVLKGGFDTNFKVNGGYSALTGSLSVNRGSLTVEGVVIR